MQMKSHTYRNNSQLWLLIWVLISSQLPSVRHSYLLLGLDGAIALVLITFFLNLSVRTDDSGLAVRTWFSSTRVSWEDVAFVGIKDAPRPAFRARIFVIRKDGTEIALNPFTMKSAVKLQDDVRSRGFGVDDPGSIRFDVFPLLSSVNIS